MITFIPYYQGGNSCISNLPLFHLLLPVIVLMAILSQLILAPFSNNGESFFVHHYTIPLAIGHFGICDILLEIIYSLNIINKPTCKNKIRIIRMAFFTYATSLKICFMIFNGSFGPIGYIGWINILGIYIQVIIGSILFNLLDKLCEDLGLMYGGISIYNSLLVCTELCRYFLSPITIKTSEGKQFEGLFLAFIHLSFNQNPLYAFFHIWNRHDYLDIQNLCLVILSIIVMTYLMSIKIVFKFSSQQNCTSKLHCKSHSYHLISGGSMPFRLFNALYLSKAVIPFIDKKIRSLSYETCLAKRSVPSMFDDMCYGYSVISLNPATRPIKTVEHSVLFYILKIVGCAILHKKWFFLTKSAPNFLHENLQPILSNGEDNDDIKQNYVSIDNEIELKRMLDCLSMLNGLIVGILAVIGDLTDFPIVSFMGFINVVKHFIQKFNSIKR